MTYEFEYMMHLFSCGARGMTPQPPHQPVDYDRLIHLAMEQSVLPLVGVALSRASNIGFSNEKNKTLLNIIRSAALSNYIRKRQILNLLLDFEKAGIQAVLLKGYAVADLYADPDCRISSDTDIYVKRKDEKQAYRLLKEHGCIVVPRSPLSHHAVCEHPKMGHIELHVSLYDEFVENMWFGKTDDQKFIQEEYERHEFSEGSCLTLGMTDSLIFLALHMMKHFINSGISLRQMMDIALYLKTYRPQIDFKRFWATLESLKYMKVMNTVLSVLVTFGGFSSDDFIGFKREDLVAVSSLSNDIETGGWLGSNETEGRKDAGYMYNRKKFLESRNAFVYWYYMLKRCFVRCFHSAIPSIAMLENKYPYTQRMRLLMPIAWIQHVLTGTLRLLLGKFDTGIVSRKEQSSNQNSRIHLFKLMQMM